MEIKQNETNKYYEVLSNPFFATICDFHSSTAVYVWNYYFELSKYLFASIIIWPIAIQWNIY